MTQDDYIDKNIGYEAVESLPDEFKEFLEMNVEDLNKMMERELENE